MTSRARVRGIDEELWFGNYSDADAEKKAAESVAATVGRVVGAKPFPVAAQRLAEATRDPNCNLVQVVRILERDMALSARVLRLVNSASFALRTPCTSVRHAASLVGTEKLNQLASTAAILDMVDSSSVHASRILEHSAVVGGLSRYLGVHLGLPADELFTCGFLHDIGKLMLLEVEGKKYASLLDEVGDDYDTIHLYERDLFGFDHALLAGHVLTRWNIPDPVPKVVAWHHHVTRAYEEGPRCASLVNVLRLADLLSYSLASADDEAEVERVARSESASYLDISAAQLAAVWDEMRTLHERSRALFRGEDPPESAPVVSLRPSSRVGRPSASMSLRATHPSLRPAALRGVPASVSMPSSSGAAGGPLGVVAPQKVTIKDAAHGPQQFPCVVCEGPSFANVCPACHGYVCPEHQRGQDDWCQLCRQEYVAEAEHWRLRPILTLILGAGIGATIVGAFFSVASGRGYGSIGLLIGPLIGTGLAAGLVAILHRYAQRAWFLRTRPDRSAAERAKDVERADGEEHVPDSGVRESAGPADVAGELRLPDPPGLARDGGSAAPAPSTSRTGQSSSDAASGPVLSYSSAVLSALPDAMSIVSSGTRPVRMAPSYTPSAASCIPSSAPDARSYAPGTVSRAPVESSYVPAAFTDAPGAPSYVPAAVSAAPGAASYVPGAVAGAPVATSHAPSSVGGALVDESHAKRAAAGGTSPSGFFSDPPAARPVGHAQTVAVLPVARVGSGVEQPSWPPSLTPPSKEAEERGRTLRLLSEHGVTEPKDVAPASSPPQQTAARRPVSSPSISVRPLFGGSVRPVSYPEWARGVSAPATESTRVAASAASALAPAPSSHEPWRTLLQATGTADGW